MEENLQESRFMRIMKLIWPTVTRIVSIIVYGIVSFIRTAVQYISDQIRDY